MVWASLKQALRPEEFIIDEQPAPVYEPEPVVKPQVAEVKDDAESAHAGQGRDLLSQMADLLIEQVRLAEHARQLEQKKGTDDEFGRFVRQVLPFLDNYAHLLDLAREHPPSEEINNWLRSVEALYFRIVNLLESYGLRFINSVGKVVDLDYHEVIDYRPTMQHPHNTIIKELQKGVVFRGRLLRDAKVVVACNTSNADAN